MKKIYFVTWQRWFKPYRDENTWRKYDVEATNDKRLPLWPAEWP